MVNHTRIVLARVGLWLVSVGLSLCLASAAQNQEIPPVPTDVQPILKRPKKPKKPRLQKYSDQLPQTPSLPPAFTIPVEPLGFSPHGDFYIGRHNSIVSLDFLDENRLLFTFQVRGLMSRAWSTGLEVRPVRAVVVALPDGKIQSEAEWTLHDRARYLWMLNDGNFLLRDRDSLQQGDSSLAMKPSLRFPGRLLWIEMDPSQRFMDTNFVEPRPEQKPEVAANLASAKSGKSVEKTNPGPKNDLVVRTLNRESGKLVLENRLELTETDPVDFDGYIEAESAMLSGLFARVQLPINSEGYLLPLRDNGENQWHLQLKHFAGGSRELGGLESTCMPSGEFISEGMVVVTACPPAGGWDVVAISTQGRQLWQTHASSQEVWPVLVRSRDGSRLARESVFLNHSIDERHPLDPAAVKGQMVKVLDAADGKVALEAPVSPPLDAGGNVAISPSGRRVAILNAGTIQVFDLPPAAPVSFEDSKPSHH
jgi:hypothetical protein